MRRSCRAGGPPASLTHTVPQMWSRVALRVIERKHHSPGPLRLPCLTVLFCSITRPAAARTVARTAAPSYGRSSTPVCTDVAPERERPTSDQDHRGRYRTDPSRPWERMRGARGGYRLLTNVLVGGCGKIWDHRTEHRTSGHSHETSPTDEISLSRSSSLPPMQATCAAICVRLCAYRLAVVYIRGGDDDRRTRSVADLL